MSTRRPLASPHMQEAVTYGSFFLGLAPLLWALLVAVGRREWSAAGAIAFLLLTLVILLVRIARRHRPRPAAPTSEFRPFVELGVEDVWPRPLDTARLAADILAEKDHLSLVIGSSGVGKTTLLTVMVPDYLQKTEPELRYHPVSADAILQSGLEKAIAAHPAGGRSVVVLDQFEQWLARSRDLFADARADEEHLLRTTLLAAMATEGLSVVLGVRREWYYDLRFLGALIPGPSLACAVQGPRVSDAEDLTRQAMLTSFVSVLKDRAFAEHILLAIAPAGRLSPLETQIVGAVVEQQTDLGAPLSPSYFDRMGGANGALESFFKNILEGAERPDTCLRVLCALSVRTRFRQEAALRVVLSTLFEDSDDVREAVAYLQKQGLIVRRTAGAYELAHDFLAEYFNSKSGAELNPIERDNILCHAEARGATNAAVLTEEEFAEAAPFPLGRFVAIPLLVLITLRFLYLGIPWTLLGPSIAQPIKTNLFDTSYIPIFVPHAAWIVYVAVFYDRVFARLHESGLGRAFSVFVVLNMMVSIIFGVIAPFTWLLGIATGGLVVALKLLSLARREDLNRTARERLYVFGSTTLFNLIFLTGFGIADLIVSFRLVHPHHHVGTWIELNLALAAAMTYACVVLASVHVSRSGVSQLLGLMARPLRFVIPRAAA